MFAVDKKSKGKLGDFLTIGQAAAYLGVSASTLRNWDRSGKLKAARHPLNRYRLYQCKALENLLSQLDAQTG